MNQARQRKFFRWAWKILAVIILLVLLVLLAIFVDSWLQKRKANTPSKATDPVTSTIAPSTQIFTSPYFQFQTDKNWRAIANESTTTKYVYRRGTDNHVEGDMTVYINSSPDDVQATRVMPVVLNSDGTSLEASFVSDHCKKNLSKPQQENTGEVTLTLNSVRFVCDVDGNLFSVIVGLENATPVMNFRRPDGTNANYIIVFTDLRFTPQADELEKIMDTFQIR